MIMKGGKGECKQYGGEGARERERERGIRTASFQSTPLNPKDEYDKSKARSLAPLLMTNQLVPTASAICQTPHLHSITFLNSAGSYSTNYWKLQNANMIRLIPSHSIRGCPFIMSQHFGFNSVYLFTSYSILS